ncbi:hypothetical protein D3C84_1059730 [compost metagenome]
MVVVAQFDANELATGRRRRVDVHRHVIHRAAADADQLALGAGALEMQAAQYPARRARVVVLHEGQGDARLAIALDLKGFDEETTLIAEHLRLDDQHPRQRRFDDLHWAAS